MMPSNDAVEPVVTRDALKRRALLGGARYADEPDTQNPRQPMAAISRSPKPGRGMRVTGCAILRPSRIEQVLVSAVATVWDVGLCYELRALGAEEVLCPFPRLATT